MPNDLALPDGQRDRYLMPRTYPPRRTLIAVRLAPAGVAEIDAQAAAKGVDRSTMIRTLLSEALTARQSVPTRRAAQEVG